MPNYDECKAIVLNVVFHVSGVRLSQGGVTHVNPLILLSTYGLPLFVLALLKPRNRNRRGMPECLSSLTTNRTHFGSDLLRSRAGGRYLIVAWCSIRIVNNDAITVAGNNRHSCGSVWQ